MRENGHKNKKRPTKVMLHTSLKNGSGTRMSDWMDTRTCSSVDVDAFQLSPRSPSQVPNNDRQTLPSATFHEQNMSTQ